MRKQQCRMACDGGGALSRSTRRTRQPSAVPADAPGAASTNSITRGDTASAGIAADSTVWVPLPLQCSWQSPGCSGSIAATPSLDTARAHGMPAIASAAGTVVPTVHA